MQARQIMAALAVLGMLAAGALLEAYTLPPASAQAAPAAAAPTVRSAALPDFAAIVQQFGPAVVNITTAGTRKAAASTGQVPFPELFRGPAPPEAPTQGQGSGFIISADGIVLTNAHVVQGASEITVKLTDRREFRARLLGTDAATDVAVLRVEARDLPVVKLGNPAQARVGDWVLAIGSPFGFENSVTAGIVSAKGRALPGDAYVPFIQTDVAVNPGNSGGPLFSLNGEVIGINSQIYSRSGGYQGLSFAIPIDVVLRVKDQIVASGRASHARLGVNVQTLNQALAESFGLQRAIGGLIAGVAPGSPADKAGLLPGDVVLKFNGRPVADSGQLAGMVGESRPGDQARLEVLRRGKKLELVATLGATADAAAPIAAADESAGEDRLGLAVRPLTPQESKAAHVTGGLLVQGVNGAAARAGMAAGDIVLQAGGKRVSSVEDLRAATQSAKVIALLVQRGEQRLFVPLQAG